MVRGVVSGGLDPRIAWQKAVLSERDLPRSVRHVAVALATHLRLNLTGAVPMADLMTETGYERTQVLVALRVLKRSGWLEVVRAHGPGQVKVYRAEIPGLLRRSDVEQVRGAAPVAVEQVRGAAPLLKENYVRTYASRSRVKPAPAGPAALASPAVDSETVGRVLADLNVTRLRPKSPAHTNRLRGLVQQRLEAGVTPAEVIEDARSVTVDPLDPPALFASVVRRAPWTAEPSIERPEWCGECDEATRLLELADGRSTRCPVCHPLAVAL
jgi:hypothetical protein